MGEMTSETGIAHECIKYSRNLDLPIHFIIEDNEKSVCTDTRKTWKQKKLSYEVKMINLLHFTVINLNGHMQARAKEYNFNL